MLNAIILRRNLVSLVSFRLIYDVSFGKIIFLQLR
jgi:hypothetical protein